MEVEEAFYDELIAYVDHKVKRRVRPWIRKDNLLGLAQRAGKLISGEELVIKVTRKKKAKLVFLANDAASNLTKKGDG